MKNNQNGRSMVEMLGVLAIIGVLSAGGLAGYSKSMFKHKLNNTIDQLTMLVTNIRTMYGTQDNYTNLSAKQAISLGIIPATMKNGASALLNPFKGAVAIEPFKADKDGKLYASGFKVTYSGLPREACIAIATADWGSGAGSGFIGVTAGGKSTAATVGVAREGEPLQVSEAIDGCTSDQSSVELRFY